MARSNDSTERAGVHAVGQFFTGKLGWIFREQHESDFGIDAHVEVKEDGKASGQLTALQIKTGKSYLKKRGDSYVYRGSERHLDYWLNHPLPVVLLIHDPETGTTYWQKIEKSLCEVTDKGWSIEIPRRNVLDEWAADVFRTKRPATPEEIRREHLKYDLDLIDKVSQHETTFKVTVDDNPHLGVTDLTASYQDKSGKENNFLWESYGGGYVTVHEAMQDRYWFLDYDYADDVYRYDECEEHALIVKVKPEVLGYLAVEKILREGPPETPEPEIPYEEPTFDEEFSQALEDDWQAELAAREG